MAVARAAALWDRPWLRTATILLVLAGLLGTAFMVFWWGAAGIGALVWRGLPALPAAFGVHAVQLALGGLAWRCMMRPRPPSRRAAIRARWVREALNTALPLAGIGGAVAGTRMLSRENGVGAASATAALTADLTLEALSQAPFLTASLAVVAVCAPGRIQAGRAALAILPVLLGAIGFVLAQRAGMMRLIERAAARFGFGDALAGLHERLMALHARPAAVARAFLLHFLGWSLGGAEVWVILHAMDVDAGPLAAFGIEGLGMAGRSLGFALPAGLAIQEAGFVVAGALFGIGPRDALAMAMIKRVREILVAALGVAIWRAGTQPG